MTSGQEQINKTHLYAAVSIILAAILLDLASKYAVFSRLDPHEVIVVISGFFRILRSMNPGGAFGVGADIGNILFLILSSCIAIGLIMWLFYRGRILKWHMPGRIYGDKARWLFTIPMSMIIGGAIGNLYDRILYGAVRDFLDFYITYKPIQNFLLETFGTYAWPTFNIADSFICVGVFTLMWQLFKEDRELKRAEDQKKLNDSHLSPSSPHPLTGENRK